MNEEEFDIGNIQNNLQVILNKNHKDPEKKRLKIKNYGSRPVIEMACPICGDSHHSSSRKRGNLYLNNLYYICYNCGMRLSYIKFLENFGIYLEPEEKLKIYKHVDTHTKFNIKEDYSMKNLDKILNLEKTFEIYNKRQNDIYNIEPIQKNSAAYQYLKYERLISNFDNLYQGTYKVTDKWREPVIIILNRNENNLLGFQLRNLKSEKNKRIYKIYDFQSIYNYINTELIEDTEAIAYNKLSHFYNILNVDFNNVITIFEGYLDSIFFPNSIGTTGVDTDYDFLLENNDIQARFFYDNDEVGLKKSIEKINKGYSVFLWKKLFENISKDSKKSYYLKNNIKDLNDLVKLIKNDNVYTTLKLENYFSIDEFDKIYL